MGKTNGNKNRFGSFSVHLFHSLYKGIFSLSCPSLYLFYYVVSNFFILFIGTLNIFYDAEKNTYNTSIILFYIIGNDKANILPTYFFLFRQVFFKTLVRLEKYLYIEVVRCSKYIT